MQVQDTTQFTVGRDSHLFVILSGGGISCLLVVADYESATSFSHSTSLTLPSNFKIENLDSLLSEQLNVWGQEIGWEMVDGSTKFAIPLDEEADRGLGGATLVTTSEYFDEDYYSELLATNPVMYGDDLQLKGATKLMGILNASDLILVVLNWEEISVLVLSAGKNVQIEPGKIHVTEFRLKKKEIEDIFQEKLQSLMSVRVSRDMYIDLIANVFTNRRAKNYSMEVLDLLRAYVTTSLFKLDSMSFRRFGMETSNGHLLVTGDLAGILPRDQLLLAVIDGLQLRGRYMVGIDDEYRYTFGTSMQENVPGKNSLKDSTDDDMAAVSQAPKNTRRFVFPEKEIYPGGYMYLSTEKGVSGSVGKRSFTGKVNLNVFGGRTVAESISLKEEADNLQGTAGLETDKLIIGQVGQIYTIDAGTSGRITIKPERSVYFPNLTKESEFFFHDFESYVEKIIIDCRKVPVVYGPDIEANFRSVKEWLRGL